VSDRHSLLCPRRGGQNSRSVIHSRRYAAYTVQYETPIAEGNRTPHSARPANDRRGMRGELEVARGIRKNAKTATSTPRCVQSLLNPFVITRRYSERCRSISKSDHGFVRESRHNIRPGNALHHQAIAVKTMMCACLYVLLDLDGLRITLIVRLRVPVDPRLV
jgi:hypothetical protein